MPAKTKLIHALDNGRIETRTTARAYTHVVVARDEHDYDHAERLSYLADQPERYTKAVAYAEARSAEQRTDLVLSWHGSEALAYKAAMAATASGAWTHARVEAINGGAR